MHPRKSSNNLSRRVICGLLALITVCSLCFLPGMAVEAHAAKTVTIPDPADYFGDVDDTDTGKTYTAYYFEGYPTFPKSKVDKYVSALKKAGLSVGSKDSTGTLINMKYGKEEKLQIIWHSDSKRDGGYLRINVQQPLTISASETTTVTKPTETTKSVSISNPADYFGSVDKTVKLSGRTSYYFDGYSSYPSSKVTSYIKALKDDGLTGGTVKDSGSDKRAALKYQNMEKLWIVWDKSKKQICVNVSKDLSVAKAGGTATTTETTPTKPKSTGPSVLELIEDCFGSYTKKTYDEENYKTVFLFKSTATFPQAKFDKLKKYAEANGMKYFLHDHSNKKGMSVYHDVGGSLIAGEWIKKSGELKIWINWEYVKKSGFFDASEIPEEPEEETVPVPNGTKTCGTCYGRKSCQSCGGKGEIKKMVIGQPGEYTTKTCTTCYGLKKCPTCRGYGWVHK